MGVIKVNGEPSPVSESVMRGWLSRNEGAGLLQAAQRMGWKKAKGPVATVVVSLVDQGKKIQGSRWQVMGDCDEAKVKAATLYGEASMEYEIGINLSDLSKFVFTHKEGPGKANNMSR